ncbi:hypothetical protein PybrP1_001579 [[Pythium] brassicae (nom. inval.)]|nr:hypothetical protein PybrP1_001579 [[Pythium] brassicae (nom. inval.)]
MGNCCSTESTDHAAHAHAVPQTVAAQQQQQQQQQAAAAAASGANGANGANGSAEIHKLVGDKPPPQQQLLHAGVDVVKDPLVEPAPSSSSSSSGPLHPSPPRSASKKSVASGRTHEGPGPTHALRIGSYNLRYAYYSKRGYYPEARKKANQDSFYCETHFAGDDQKAFFAVFDGHGQYGDICSQFAAEYLPEYIVKHLEDNVGVLPALTRAHLETNQEIHIANVGDSRAIIAQDNLKATGPYEDISLVAKPLSIDQTPFRKDERERVKKCGARILTVDQVEGFEPIHENWGLNLGDEIDENGDPPRIWHPYGQYPGTAFTRSMGDLVSEELGVTAEPEILCKALNAHDKFIVIASDGVFEFLTSQNVVDIVKKYDDPAAACEALVEEAYARWLQFEVRTDDITAICIFLDGLTANRDLARGSIYVGGEVLDLQSMQRPVRGGIGGKKPRNTIVGTEAIRLSLTEGLFDGEDPSELYALRDNVAGDKSDSEIKWIKDIVQENFLFNHLSDVKILEVISVLKKVEVEAGDVVIRQGAPGDTFYLIESGEFEVRVNPEELRSSQFLEVTATCPEDYGDVVHVYKAGPHLHPTFGELALIYSKPRAATVIAKEKGALWALDRLAFRSILMRGRPMRDVVHRLRQISLLRPLTVAQTNLVAEEMKVLTFDEGQFVFHEGMNEPGFFLITSGKVECTSKQSSVATLQLKALDYFGEVALVRRRSISQRTIRALEKTECLFITKETFEQAVGKLSSILEKDKIRRFRKEWISESRKAAKPNSLVLFDKPSGTDGGLPQSIDQLEIVGDVFSGVTNTVRLVMVKGSSPPQFMTLRTVSKQAIFDASMQTHVAGERDIYVSLYEKNALVPHVYGMNSNDTDIHVLYATQVVGSLESFLHGEAHGESFVRYYAAQVVLALEFLHSEGIVSRTADPSNLMIDRNGNIRMLNLRLSKYVGRGRTYTVCGTPEYLSPEQIKGEGHNVAADYWSLGVLMYELLCGHTPFSLEKKDDIEILNQITSFRPEQLTWPESASAEVKDIIQKLLCPDLSARLGVQDLRGNFAQNVCEGIKRHPFFAGTSWEATKIGSFSAPLEAEAAVQFKQITANGAGQDLNIGTKYTGDFDWLTGF